MKTKTVLKVNAILFGIIALVHVARLVTGFPVQIGNYAVPTLVSALGAIVAGWLCFENWKATL